MDPCVGHLNGILARVGGNLNNNFQKSQMPGGLPGAGMLKLRFDRYINKFLYVLVKLPHHEAKLMFLHTRLVSAGQTS